MLCNYKVIKKKDLSISNWSGGTTTQLSIYPENQLYSDRNFLWRLSSATVDQDISNFTALPQYNRILMILEGRLELNHNNKEIINLNSFDQNEFDGGNNTIAKGKVVDFNLMMRKGQCTGNVKHFEVLKNDTMLTNEINGFYKHDNYTLVFYNYKGSSNINIVDDVVELLDEGDVLVVTFKEQVGSLILKMTNTSGEKSDIIIAQIYY